MFFGCGRLEAEVHDYKGPAMERDNEPELSEDYTSDSTT